MDDDDCNGGVVVGIGIDAFVETKVDAGRKKGFLGEVQTPLIAMMVLEDLVG